MPNKCEKCGKEFYSDTEFMFHKQAHENNLYLIWLIGELRLSNILKIAEKENLDIEGATIRYMRVWNMVGDMISGKLKNEDDSSIA